MSGKHSSLPVTKSGFTPEAKRSAEAKNIITLTLDEAAAAEWRKLVTSLNEGLRIGSFTFEPCGVRVTADGRPLAVSEANVVRRVGSEQQLTLRDYVLRTLHRRDLLPQVFGDWVKRENRPDKFEFKVEVTPNQPTQIQTGDGSWRNVQQIEIRAAASMNALPLQLTGARFRAVNIAYAKVPNIFKGNDGSAGHVIVSLLADGDSAIIEKASLLFPAKGQNAAEVHDMTIASQPGTPPGER